MSSPLDLLDDLTAQHSGDWDGMCTGYAGDLFNRNQRVFNHPE